MPAIKFFTTFRSTLQSLLVPLPMVALQPEVKERRPGNKGSRKKELSESVKTISKELQVEDPEFDRWCDKVVAVLEKAKKRFFNGRNLV